MTSDNGWFRLESTSSGNRQQPGRSPAQPSKGPVQQSKGEGAAQGSRATQGSGTAQGGGAARPAAQRPQGTPNKQMHRTGRPQHSGLPTRPPQGAQRPVPPPPPRQPRPQKEIHSQTVGERGPVLTQDTVLHETLEDFVTSTTLGRVVHTKGFGAFGHFQTTHSMRDYTTASIFQTAGTQVQAVTRFSLAVSTAGTPDTSRNVRGFSTKFFTDEGVFDLLCNHLPVFLVRDAIRFPDSIRAFQPSPVNNLLDPDRFWGFVATAPEATHFVTWLYSDIGTIKSLRHIRAYSVNTYVWKNAAGARTYVKYHWIPVAGEQHIEAAESVKLAGENPDIAGQDLYNTIAAGTPVEYELHVQLMNPADEAALPFDPLDDTKVWDEAQYPLMPVGKLTLNRNPDNFAEQIEKLAFAPSNLLEGIEFTDDKMLQGRTFIYPDAQRHRLGNEFRKLPANRQERWKPNDMVTSGIGREVEGTVMRAEIPKQDDFTQAGQRYESLSPEQQDHLVRNIAGDLAGASRESQQTVLTYLTNASAELGSRVAQEMGR